jgi:NMD protein affecting ribosome stability and mRNA decay
MNTSSVLCDSCGRRTEYDLKNAPENPLCLDCQKTEDEKNRLKETVNCDNCEGRVCEK